MGSLFREALGVPYGHTRVARKVFRAILRRKKRRPGTRTIDYIIKSPRSALTDPVGRRAIVE